jgi:hypothetical protein
LHNIYTLNIFPRVIANPANGCGFYTIWYPLKAHFDGFAVTLVKIFKV